MATIRIEHLSRKFGTVQAVNDISLTVPEKELFTLLGPSGCGKTTLLRMVAGFCDIDHGAVFFDDRRIDVLPAHQRDIGMVFQNYAIFPNLTVEQNVAYGLRARKVPARQIRPRVEAALDRVRLRGYGRRRPHELSGGQLQRVAIARSLVIEPAVLLFDEPLSNLDAQLRVAMRVEIRQLQRSLGVTTIYVTHDQEEALAISDHIAVLRDGRLEQVGHPESIYHAPRTAFVAEFMGGTNLIPGIVSGYDGKMMHVSAGSVTILVKGRSAKDGERVVLSLRPETLHLASSDGSARPRLTARLELREFLGPMLRLHLRLSDGNLIRASILSSDERGVPQEGDVALEYDPAQVLVFSEP